MQGHYELNVFKPLMAANFYIVGLFIRCDACLHLTNIVLAVLNQTTNVSKELVDPVNVSYRFKTQKN
jgi:fumarate hydratase class II